MLALEWETVPCPLCGARDEEEFLQVPASGSNPASRIARCRSCGMVYSNPRVNERTVGLLYPDDYEPYEGPQDGRDAKTPGFFHRLVLSRFWGYPSQHSGLLNDALAWMARPFVGPGRSSMMGLPWVGEGRLLEFGCGSGWLAQRLSRLGWSVTCMDFSEHSIERVRQRYGLPGIVGSLPHPQMKAESFDAITMGMVLEHVHDPHALINAAVQILRPGGQILISVPNIESWSFRTFGAGWWGLQMPCHLSHFSASTLRGLVEKHGLQVASLTTVERPGWWRRSVKQADELGLPVPWPLRMRIAQSLMGRWAGRTGQGDSLHLLARKPACAKVHPVRLAG